MNISIFDVIGPVMIGPSSSHTAGAARLARAGAMLCTGKLCKVSFALHGSFLLTGQGHGTHEALLAGAIGLAQDDERIASAFSIAKAQGIEAEFTDIVLAEAHENSAQMTFYNTEGGKCVVEGSSIGGGRILLTGVDGCRVNMSCERPSLLIIQNDEPGVVSEISQILAQSGINIALMQVTRENRGKLACTVIETDNDIPSEVAQSLARAHNILSVRVIDMK